MRRIILRIAIPKQHKLVVHWRASFAGVLLAHHCMLMFLYAIPLTRTILVRQNNVEELYSLLKFLRIRPLDDWQTFNEQINKPVKSGRSVRAMKRLHVNILALSIASR